MRVMRSPSMMMAPWPMVTPAVTTTKIYLGGKVIPSMFQEAGTYTGEIAVAGNDVITPLVTVPVTMAVLPDGLMIDPRATVVRDGRRLTVAAEDIVRRVLSEECIVKLANHTWLVTPDGREIPIEDSAAPIKDGARDLFREIVERLLLQPRDYLSAYLLFASLAGGVIAAPLGALVTRRLPVRVLMILVGLLIITVSMRTILMIVF